MKKILLSLTFLCVSIFTANAAKSTGEPRAFLQPDGTTLMVRLIGDEHVSWHQTMDGAIVVQRGKAFYVARINSDGSLESTGILAHNLDNRKQQEKELVKAQNKDLMFSKANQDAPRRIIPGYPSSRYSPHMGNMRIPIIMMDFAETDTNNVKFIFDKAVFEEYFNGTTRTPYSSATKVQGYSSVSQYFSDASNGMFTPQFDIYGPYTTKMGHDYYGRHQNDGYPGGSHSTQLLTEAIAAADDDIDFSLYDSNNDGYTDIVYILYAGASRNLSGDDNDFHASCYSGMYINTKDGKTVNVIGGTSELAASIAQTGDPLRAGIGVFCHEMSHGLGMPDLYWTKATAPKDANGLTDYNNCGPEDRDLMDGGENLYNGIWPCQYTAWERDIMGWMELEELSEPADITIYPLNKENGKAYRITNPDNEYEYYVLENTPTDEWNQYLSNQYGTGLMITHVNASPSGFTMTPNNTYGTPNITIIPADGYILASYSKGETINYRGEVVTMPSSSSDFRSQYFTPETQGDPYPGSLNVTEVAAYKNYSGEEDLVSKFPITNIVKNGDGSISFKFMGGVEPTGISSATAKIATDSRIFTLDGRLVGSSRTSLPQGIYLQNGKKFVK